MKPSSTRRWRPTPPWPRRSTSATRGARRTRGSAPNPTPGTATTCGGCTSRTATSPGPSRYSGSNAGIHPERDSHARSGAALHQLAAGRLRQQPRRALAGRLPRHLGHARCSTPTATTWSRPAAAAPTRSARTPTGTTAAHMAPGQDQLGTDLNRNFPFLWGCCGGSSGAPCDETYRGPSAGSEDETQAVMAKIRRADPRPARPEQQRPGAHHHHRHLPEHALQRRAATSMPGAGPHRRRPTTPTCATSARHMSARQRSGGNGYLYCQPVRTASTPSTATRSTGATASWAYPASQPSWAGTASPQYFLPGQPRLRHSRGIWPENRGMLIYQAKIARTPYLLDRAAPTPTRRHQPYDRHPGHPV